jgi:hypothetical protein
MIEKIEGTLSIDCGASSQVIDIASAEKYGAPKNTQEPPPRPALQMLWHELRCHWCEVLIGWAMKIAPADYQPSFISVVIDAYHRRGAFTEGARIDHAAKGIYQ